MSAPVLTEARIIGLLLIWNMVVIMMYIYNVLRYIQLGRRLSLKMLTAGLGFIAYLLYEVLNSYAAGGQLENMSIIFRIGGLRATGLYLISARPAVIRSVPWILLVLMLTAAWQQVQIGIWRRLHISSASVKEGFDLLPVGCCYSYPSGLPKLVNQTMDRISKLLTGGSVADAEKFWQLLKSGKLSGTIDDGDYPILRLGDGSVFSFWRDEIRTEDGLFYELIAVDVTEEYRLTRELEEKQREAKIQNSRLKALIDTIEYVTMSRELLQIKTALHDNLGQRLLYARRYLLAPDSVDRTEMLKVWNDNLRHLQHEGPEDWQLPYYVIGKQAEKLGIDLTIEGKLPTEEHLLTVTDAAISAHIINVLRHAGGTRVLIRITETPGTYTMRFTNDGRPPKGEIREKGGLSNLRREVEAAGGTMAVKSSPYFELILTLPKQKETD